MDSAKNLICVLILIAGTAAIVLAQSQSEAQSPGTSAEAAESVAHCSFHQAGDHFVGGCGKLFNQEPEMTLRPAAAIKTGVWRDNLRPIAVWAGDMTDKGYLNAPLELEIYTGDRGILWTEYGWFAVSKFTLSPTMRFDLDHAREVRPSNLDQKIVKTAAEILSTEIVWNRNDNRKCPATATRWSIYCAMEKATIAVTGGFHHRRPAMEVVRKIVEERTAGRNYHHRLMDYNNDPTTHLSDVQSLLKEALRRMD